MERNPEIKPFSCKLCDKTFFQVYEVKEHIKIHNSISEVEDLKTQVKSLKIQVEEFRMKLERCQSKPKTRQKNKFKQKSEEISQEGLKDILKQRKYLNQLKENHKNKKEKRTDIDHSSPKGPKTDKTKPSNANYFCSICKYQSGDKSNFRRHKIRKHGTQEKIFECDECSTKFITKEYLKKHITGVHRGRKFKCERCNVELKTPQGLKWHLKIHDREM